MKQSRWMNKLRAAVPQKTWLTRTLAGLAALLIIVSLLVMVNDQVGNPLSAWYNEQKIIAHFNTYHPGEGYVVGPAQYQWVYSPSVGLSGNYYVSRVYQTGSVDTGFCAIFYHDAVLTTKAVETDSGSNTYNRFHNEAVNLVDWQALRQALESLHIGFSDVSLQFYADGNTQVFSLTDPVFQVDEPFDANHLPLPLVMVGYFWTEGEEVGHADVEMLADRLCALKEACQKQGDFPYYSVELYDGQTAQFAYDIPAEQIPENTQGQQGQALVEYLENLPAENRSSESLYDIASGNAAVTTQRYAVLYGDLDYQPCNH